METGNYWRGNQIQSHILVQCARWKGRKPYRNRPQNAANWRQRKIQLHYLLISIVKESIALIFGFGCPFFLQSLLSIWLSLLP
jgi:hypothetical protein